VSLDVNGGLPEQKSNNVHYLFSQLNSPGDEAIGKRHELTDE